MPLCSASLVFTADRVPGASSAICGSLAVRPINASIETAMPGAIATPRYSPSGEIAMKTVAVPKLTTISGAPKRSRAADRGGDEIGADLGRILGDDRHQTLRLRLQESAARAEEARRRVSSTGSSCGTTLAIATASIALRCRSLVVERAA